MTSNIWDTSFVLSQGGKGYPIYFFQLVSNITLPILRIFCSKCKALTVQVSHFVNVPEQKIFSVSFGGLVIICFMLLLVTAPMHEP